MKRLSILLSIAAIVLPAATAQAQTSIRPIEDFVSTQGTFCFPDGGGGCLVFVPPVENFFGWQDPEKFICASIDYAGLADEWAGDVFGTAFAGNVVEQTLTDGRAMVSVNLHTANALTWVVDGCDFAGDPLLFGDRAPEVVAGLSAGGFCDSILKVSFINTAPGDPLPDLLQLLAAPEDGQELMSLAIRCNAKGPLRPAFGGVEDQTPGRVMVNQTALFFAGNLPKGVGHDGFPVEFIDIKQIGQRGNGGNRP